MQLNICYMIKEVFHISEEKYIIYTQINSKWIQYFLVKKWNSDFLSKMYNLNLIKGKHQTNPDEGPSTKWLAWNLLAVSGKAGRGSRRSSRAGGETPGCGQSGDGIPSRGRAGFCRRWWRKMDPQESSGGPVVRALCFHCWDPSSVTGPGTNILQVAGYHKKKNRDPERKVLGSSLRQPVAPTRSPVLCLPGFLNSPLVITDPSLYGTLWKLRKTLMKNL